MTQSVVDQLHVDVQQLMVNNHRAMVSNYLLNLIILINYPSL